MDQLLIFEMAAKVADHLSTSLRSKIVEQGGSTGKSKRLTMQQIGLYRAI